MNLYRCLQCGTVKASRNQPEKCHACDNESEGDNLRGFDILEVTIIE
ncbi:MAG: hypothetical protein SVU88_03460 [Candidatus Nanohaloarchaea archaeon]|nr:hypothetical protein [Candidatus Nanohaloarchaea archaeon]